MALFQKKTTLVHHITYMGIMTAINLIFIVLATYIPFLMFLLILLLPFASTIVSYYCLKRYYLIYAIASIGLCFIFNINDTIFYVVPAIVTGFVSGVLLERKIHPFWLVLSSSIIETGLTFAFIPLINLLSNVNIVDTFMSIFKLEGFAYKTELTYLFIFFISFLQCALTQFVLLSDAKKIGIDINTRISCFYPYIIGLETIIILGLALSFVYLPLALTFVAISFYFGVFLLIDVLLSKKPIVYISLAISLITAFFIFAIFYTKISAPSNMILFVLFSLAICLTSFIKNCLLNCQSNI